jgi:hypothetical protein
MNNSERARGYEITRILLTTAVIHSKKNSVFVTIGNSLRVSEGSETHKKSF